MRTRAMKPRVRGVLRTSLFAGAVLGPFTCMACRKNPQEPSPSACPFPTTCLVSDAAAADIDGTKPIPVQDCIAAAARAILTTEQQIGMLGQMSASDPTVKAVAQQMSEDFTTSLIGPASGNDLASISTALEINPQFDCPDKEQALGLVMPVLTQLQTLSGAAFDQQFVELEAAALQQVLDFYNEELIANANSGAFKTSLRYERWRIAGDAGIPVTAIPDASCPSPAVASTGVSPTCLGIVPEMMAVQALSLVLVGGVDASATTPVNEATDAGAE
jgi:uncharacterized protein DUF4142